MVHCVLSTNKNNKGVFMSRCKCCDVILIDRELRRSKSDGSPEDLCSDCSLVVHLDLEELFDIRDYAFGQITENNLSLAGYDFNAEISGIMESW